MPRLWAARFRLRSTQATHPTCSKSKGARTRTADPEVGHPIPRFPGMQIQAVREDPAGAFLVDSLLVRRASMINVPKPNSTARELQKDHRRVV
ncbi:MAG: hypothetical protein V3W37_04035 [Candidatus Binatia bacterium]